jgi:hypothetical protein
MPAEGISGFKKSTVAPSGNIEEIPSWQPKWWFTIF